MIHVCKVLHDDKLAPFFKGIDVGPLKEQQNKLMSLLFGGNELIMVRWRGGSFAFTSIEHLSKYIGLSISMNPLRTSLSQPTQMEDSSFDMRKIHMRGIIEDGLGFDQWEKFVTHLQETFDELKDIPPDVKIRAMEWMRSTRNEFRPAEPHEIEAFKQAKAHGGGGTCPFAK